MPCDRCSGSTRAVRISIRPEELVDSPSLNERKLLEERFSTVARLTVAGQSGARTGIMTKSDLIERLCQDQKLPKGKAELLVNSIFDCLEQALASR